ncbi:hypothetical protein [Novipirellula rosea]|uniref:hypothetical protein n=1 Tax=Novipirellula rosea TaxID=1031540 RepID=UPI0031F0083D
MSQLIQRGSLGSMPEGTAISRSRPKEIATDRLCQPWAQLRADAKKAGRVIQVADAWIAAAAILLGAPLATHNVRDCLQVVGLELIHCPVN